MNLIIVLLSIGAFALRAAVVYTSGIWADEAFFLRVVAMPSWTGMLSFLAYHESHPPFFYILMRLWMRSFGSSDQVALLLPIACGTLVVPLLYHCGRSLFSSRAGYAAALLGAVSPSLIEHSAQLRPYGLLALLSLASSYLLVIAATRRSTRFWFAYSFVTLSLLYTHNWAWLVGLGQQVAMLWVWLRASADDDVRLKPFLFAWTAIVVGYLPWVSALLYQSSHAGYSGLPIQNLHDAVTLLGFAGYSILETVLPWRYSSPRLAATVSIGAALTAAFLVSRPSAAGRYETPVRSHRAAVEIFAITLAGSLSAAIALTPLSKLLLPRCFSMLVPLLILLLAKWWDKTTRTTDKSAWQAPVATAVTVLFAVNSLFGTEYLIRTPRSNAREIAASVSKSSRPGDLLIIAPEWYGPVIDHYLKGDLEQVWFPSSGQAGLVDFANVWARTNDPQLRRQINSRIARASSNGVGVWLVTSAQYERHVGDAELAVAYRQHQPKPVTTAAVTQIRSLLERLYGSPDSGMVSSGPTPARYDDLRAYYFVPLQDGTLK